MARRRAGLLTFLLVFAAAVVPAARTLDRYQRFFFEISIATDASGPVQLFYDVGRGINEQDSGIVLAAASQTPVPCRIVLPQGVYRELRLDPSDRAATLTLTGARIISNRGRVFRTFRPAMLSPLQQIEVLATDEETLRLRIPAGGNDPILHIQLDEPILLEKGRRAWAEAVLLCLVLASFAALVVRLARERGRLKAGMLRLLPMLFGIKGRVLGWAATAFVAAFALIVFIAERWPERRPDHLLELVVRSSEAGTMQVFYDIGAGINERDSVTQSIPHGVGTRCRFALPDGTFRSLRLDPINGDAVFLLSGAKIVGRGGATIRTFDAADFVPLDQVAAVTPVADGVEVRTTPGAGDPKLRLDFDEALVLTTSSRAWAERAAAAGLIALGLAALAAAVAAGMFQPGVLMRAVLTGLFLVVAAISLFRVGSTPAPIYGHDEYAYLKRGLDHGMLTDAQQRERDPWSVQVTNFLYLSVVHQAARLFGDPTPALRTANFLLLYVVTAGLGWLILQRNAAPGGGNTYAVLVALTPSSVFVLSPMPEVFLLAGVTALGWISVYLHRRWHSLGAALAGLGFAFLCYIKPHAIAPAVSFGAYFVIIAVTGRSRPWWQRPVAPAVYALSFLAGVFLANLLLTGEPGFQPRFVSKIYSNVVTASSTLSDWLLRMGEQARYAGVHALVLCVLFPLAWVFIGQSLWERRHGRARGFFDDVALATALLGGALTVLIARFTAAAATISPAGEADRLHGRYYLVLFPALLLLGCHAAFRAQRESESVVARALRNRWLLLAHAASALTLPLVLSAMKVFPWDYPEIFSLSPLSSAVPRTLFYGSIMLLLLAGIVFRRKAHYILLTAQAWFFAVSLYGVSSWQEAHARAQSSLSAAGESIRRVSGEQARDLLVVGSDRGELTYFLCGIMADPQVRYVSLGERIPARLVSPECRFVAVLGEHAVDFAFHSRQKVGPIDLYTLVPSAIQQFERQAPDWNRQRFSAHLTFPRCNVDLHGFGQPGAAGASTLGETAEIVLPFRVHGAVQAEIRAGWETEGGKTVTFTLGNEEFSFEPATAPDPVRFTLVVPCPTDRVTLSLSARGEKAHTPLPVLTVSEIAFSPAE